jgi:hypothetical protein
MIGISQVLSKWGRLDCPNPVQASGCAVYALANLALGRFMAVVAHIKLWDMAGCWPILQRLGFEGRLTDGTPLTERVDADVYSLDPAAPDRWHLRDGCVFGAPGVPCKIAPYIEVTR